MSAGRPIGVEYYADALPRPVGYGSMGDDGLRLHQQQYAKESGHGTPA